MLFGTLICSGRHRLDGGFSCQDGEEARLERSGSRRSESRVAESTVFPPAPELPYFLDTADAPISEVRFLWEAMMIAARRASALLCVVTVILVWLVSLPAGALLAVHTYTVKYTSQVYLEALPMLTATVAVFAYLRSRRRPNRWWWLSAITLGLTAAGKYVYSVAGLAIAVDFLWDRATRRDWRGTAAARQLSGSPVHRSFIDGARRVRRSWFGAG